MTLAQQTVPDLRDLGMIVNTIVLVVNIVLIVYIKSRFAPIDEKIRALKVIADGTVLGLQDVRESFLRNSRVDEDFRQLDEDIKARFDKLETKIDCCEAKIGDCRADIAGLRASMGRDGRVKT